jgi:hypothetical protein
MMGAGLRASFLRFAERRQVLLRLVSKRFREIGAGIMSAPPGT